MPRAKRATKKKAKKAVKRVRCAAKTKAGAKCKRFTSGRSPYCALHR
ncbi:MAG TPA: hypothetical protein VN285_02640 [Candidatus Deferrimicrobium sp.]|nr:hypothetical protein [Candidatus Deferrimicrobium sp.]